MSQKKIIVLDGVKYYPIDSRVHGHTSAPGDLYVGDNGPGKIAYPGRWYRQVPEKPAHHPKKRKKNKSPTPSLISKYYTNNATGTKYYLTPIGTTGTTTSISRHGRVYEENPTMTHEGVEYFQVRSGFAREGDIWNSIGRGMRPATPGTTHTHYAYAAKGLWRPTPTPTPIILTIPETTIWIEPNLPEGEVLTQLIKLILSLVKEEPTK